MRAQHGPWSCVWSHHFTELLVGPHASAHSVPHTTYNTQHTNRGVLLTPASTSSSCWWAPAAPSCRSRTRSASILTGECWSNLVKTWPNLAKPGHNLLPWWCHCTCRHHCLYLSLLKYALTNHPPPLRSALMGSMAKLVAQLGGSGDLISAVRGLASKRLQFQFQFWCQFPISISIPVSVPAALSTLSWPGICMALTH